MFPLDGHAGENGGKRVRGKTGKTGKTGQPELGSKTKTGQPELSDYSESLGSLVAP